MLSDLPTFLLSRHSLIANGVYLAMYYSYLATYILRQNTFYPITAFKIVNIFHLATHMAITYILELLNQQLNILYFYT